MKRILTSVVVATAVGAALLAPSGAIAQQSASDGTSLVHAVPGTPVDVYIDGSETFLNFLPGATQDLSAFAGTTLTDVEIFAAGDDPTTDTPLIAAPSLAVPATGSNSVVVFVDESGNPTIATFVNNATVTGTGLGRLTVRHAAAAPAVDVVFASGDRPVQNLANGGSQELGPAARSYDLQLAAAGGDVIAGTQTTVQVNEGENIIVYAAGSLADGIVYYTETLDVGAVAATTTTTTTTVAGASTTTTTTTAGTTTTTTAAVPVAVNTGSPLGSPLNTTLVAIALGGLLVTGGAMLVRRRV